MNTKENNKAQSEFEKLLSKTPKDVEKFVDLSFDIVDEVDNELLKIGKNRSYLASLLDKSESEISKILSGMHNSTVKSVSKIAAALNTDILTTPMREAKKYAEIISTLQSKIDELTQALFEKEIKIEKLTFISARISELQFGSSHFTTLHCSSVEYGMWKMPEKTLVKDTEFTNFVIDKKDKNACETLA